MGNNVKKVIFLIFLCSLLVIFDNALMPFIKIHAYYPSLLIVFIICYSIINGKKEAIIIGILTGILQDVFFINGIGINALTNMFVCLGAAYVGDSIFRHKIFVPTITCFVLSFVKGIMVFIILSVLGQSINLKALLFSSLYNMIISIFTYKIVFKLCSMGFMKKEWRF